MSSYLTTSSAASTYQTQAGMSDYLSKAGNLAGLANTSTARTNLGLGTMSTATAADYSTTTVANGLYYPLSSNPAGYLTTAPVSSVAGKTGVVTLVAADVSGAAAIDSQAFTGTPSLPTGTTAVTQTAGNNTTAVATTAFVRSDNNVKAWVNFNGTGTVAIRASFNVSSITDNGTGSYNVNFTNSIADANYAVIADCSYTANGNRGSVWAESYAVSSSAARVMTTSFSSPFIYDSASVTVSILR
jgi:hypothetical protein